VREILDPEEWKALADPAWEIVGDDLSSGAAAEGWEASVGILHAMYENPDVASTLTHDEIDRIERGAGPPKTFEPTGKPLDIDDVAELGVLSGVGTGASSSPGHGWERLWWAELAERLGLELEELRYPTGDTFPYDSWPASIQPPAESSLDLLQFERLLGHLSDWSSDGAETECIWWYTGLQFLVLPDLLARVFRGPLREGRELYDAIGGAGSANNFWPVDKSWFVWTDFDLQGTKVSGSRGLIEALVADPELETIGSTVSDTAY
jgi:hypothetical protein